MHKHFVIQIRTHLNDQIVTLTQVLFSEYCKILRAIFLEHIWYQLLHLRKKARHHGCYDKVPNTPLHNTKINRLKI